MNALKTLEFNKLIKSNIIITYHANNIIAVGGSFQWPPAKEEEEQGPTATPMYIDPHNPTIGSLLGSAPPGASVEHLLGLAEKPTPMSGPLAQSSPPSQYTQNGSAAPTYSVS